MIKLSPEEEDIHSILQAMHTTSQPYNDLRDKFLKWPNRRFFDCLATMHVREMLRIEVQETGRLMIHYIPKSMRGTQWPSD